MFIHKKANALKNATHRKVLLIWYYKILTKRCLDCRKITDLKDLYHDHLINYFPIISKFLSFSS